MGWPCQPCLGFGFLLQGLMRQFPEVTCLGKWCAPVFGDWHLARFPTFIAREPRSPRGQWGIFLAVLVWSYFALTCSWCWQVVAMGARGSSMGSDRMDWNGISFMFGSLCCLKVAFCGGGIQTIQTLWASSRVAGFRRKARDCLVMSTTRGRRLCNLSVATNRNPAEARRNAAEGIFLQAYG